VVADVKAKKEADEAWFADLLEQYSALVVRGEAAIDAGDFAVRALSPSSWNEPMSTL